MRIIDGVDDALSVVVVFLVGTGSVLFGQQTISLAPLVRQTTWFCFPLRRSFNTEAHLVSLVQIPGCDKRAAHGSP